MSQAEIAGGQLTPAAELPRKGHRLRDFSLPSTSGDIVHLSDYRGRANLVLIVQEANDKAERLISDAAARYSEIKRLEAEVVLILHSELDRPAVYRRERNLPYPVVTDATGDTCRALGGVDVNGNQAWAVYVTDRFGEVFAIFREIEGAALPDIAEVLKWLEFIEAQCPECEAPEWPL